jgi:hypothetical protein
MNFIDRAEFYIDNHIMQPWPKHGIFTDSGFPVLESPSPDLLTKLSKNPNISYVPSRIPDAWQGLPGRLKETSLLKEDIASERSSGGWYLHYVLSIRAVFEEMVKDFPNEGVLSIRGLAASLDGDLVGFSKEVEDIKAIMQRGTEYKRRKKILVETFDAQQRDMHSNLVVSDKVGQWSGVYARDSRAQFPFNHPAASRIFPVFMVYDTTKLDYKGGYEVELPDNRDGLVKKTYVADYPYYHRNVGPGKWIHPLYLPPVSEHVPGLIEANKRLDQK